MRRDVYLSQRVPGELIVNKDNAACQKMLTIFLQLLAKWFKKVKVWGKHKSLLFMISLPQIKGLYSVGFVDLEANGVLIRIFYPTDKIMKSRKTRWIPDSWNQAKGNAIFLKSPWISFFILPIFSMIRSNYIKNAPLSNQATSFPIAIFSHGI